MQTRLYFFFFERRTTRRARQLLLLSQKYPKARPGTRTMTWRIISSRREDLRGQLFLQPGYALQDNPGLRLGLAYQVWLLLLEEGSRVTYEECRVSTARIRL